MINGNETAREKKAEILVVIFPSKLSLVHVSFLVPVGFILYSTVVVLFWAACGTKKWTII